MCLFSTLDGTARGLDVRFHRHGPVAASKLLLLRLLARDCGHGQHILVDRPVQIQDGVDFLLSLFDGGERGVALLPKELTGPEEGLGMFEFPTLRRKNKMLYI